MEHAPSSGLGSLKLYIYPWVYSILSHLALSLPELWWLLYLSIKNISYWGTKVKQAKIEKKKKICCFENMKRYF